MTADDSATEDQVVEDDDPYGFTKEENERFQFVEKHTEDLLVETAKLFALGSVLGLFLAFAFIVIHQEVPGLPSSAKGPGGDWLLYVSPDLASKILAIIATLTVALVVTMRGFSGSILQPVELARRQSLSFLLSVLSVTSVSLSLVACYSNIFSSETSFVSCAGLLIASAVLCAFSADSRMQTGKASTSDPRYESWRVTREVERFLKIGSSRGLGRQPVPGGFWSLLARAIAYSLILGSAFGAMIPIVAFSSVRIVFNRLVDPDAFWLAVLVTALLYAVTFALSMAAIFLGVLFVTLRRFDVVFGVVVVFVGFYLLVIVIGLIAWLGVADGVLQHIGAVVLWLSLFMLPAVLCAYMLLARTPKVRFRVLGHNYRVLLNNRLWRKREKMKQRAAELRRIAAQNAVID